MASRHCFQGRLPGHPPALHSSISDAPILFLEAEPVFRAAVEQNRRAVDIYFSDTEELQLSSDDLLAIADVDAEPPRVAVRLLMSDFPSPFAGESYRRTPAP